MLDNLQPENLKMRYVKKIYDHILSLHIDQPSTFNKTSRCDLSEQDFQIKFWGPIFEWFFYSAEVVLHWGDTVSTPCKAKKIRFKADLRIVITSDLEEVVDGAMAEVARKAEPRKLWLDKLKMAIGTKCHLNNFLSSVPNLPAKDVKNVVFPIIQIMRFEIRVYTLRLGNRGLYVLQDFVSFSFPTNYASLKNGIKELLCGLAKSLLGDLKNTYETNQVDEDGAMSRILQGETLKKKSSKKSWTTDVVWNDKDLIFVDDEKDEEEDDHEDEEIDEEDDDDD